MRQNKIRVFLMLVAIVSILALQARSAGAVPITHLVAPTAVDAGQSFNVDVFVDGVIAPDFVLGFGFNVDSGSFLFGGATVSGAFDYDDSLLLGLDAAGSDFPDPVSFGDDEIYGDNILLATLNFTAPLSLGAGSYRLGISSVLGNFNEGLFTFNFNDLASNTYDLSASILIQVADSGSTAVPEPSTLLLLGAGLSGLVGMGVRRRS